MFGKSLAARSLWNFISKDSLWRKIIIDKYIAPYFMLDWTWKERKSPHNVSNQWKAPTLTFPVISKFNMEGWNWFIGQSGDGCNRGM